ncbi:MAG: hypothetical protein PF439_05655 [Helicobacteraceae bacterium]|jgi:hypothetical protein|nr:hypothetical protein [Helicobacteraceae bacterium]
MAKTNYSYEKRARELEKLKKKEEKRLKKLDDKNPATKEGEGTTPPSETPSEA